MIIFRYYQGEVFKLSAITFLRNVNQVLRDASLDVTVRLVLCLPPGTSLCVALHVAWLACFSHLLRPAGACYPHFRWCHLQCALLIRDYLEGAMHTTQLWWRGAVELALPDPNVTTCDSATYVSGCFPKLFIPWLKVLRAYVLRCVTALGVYVLAHSVCLSFRCLSTLAPVDGVVIVSELPVLLTLYGYRQAGLHFVFLNSWQAPFNLPFQTGTGFLGHIVVAARIHSFPSSLHVILFHHLILSYLSTYRSASLFLGIAFEKITAGYCKSLVAIISRPLVLPKKSQPIVE